MPAFLAAHDDVIYRHSEMAFIFLLEILLLRHSFPGVLRFPPVFAFELYNFFRHAKKTALKVPRSE